MFIGRFGIIGLLIEKGIESLADRLFRSSLDKDFGEAKEDDIVLPSARCIFQGEVEGLTPPLKRMFPMIEGLRQEHLDKVLQRLIELNRRWSVTYRFQVKDTGIPVELQMILTRLANRQVEIDFRCSESIIGLIQIAFEES